jgi:membrane-associated phospholipid phosphatase
LRRFTIALVLCAFVVSGFGPGFGPGGAARAQDCAPNDPVTIALVQSGAVSYMDEPGAGEWRTWFVSPADVSVPPPPLFASPEGASDLSAVGTAVRTNHLSIFKRGDDTPASDQWTRLLLQTTAKYSAKPDRDPPRISRQIAIFQTAIEDALVIAWRAKYCYLRPPPSAFDPTLGTDPMETAPSYPSEHATAAGVASVLLSSFFPEEGSSFDALALAAGQRRVDAGYNYPSDVRAGLELGRTVALRVLAARQADGWNATWDGSGRVTGTCNWSPTPPSFKYPPLEPLWGTVTPFLMASGDQFRPAAPPACDGTDYIAAARDVYETSLHLTQRQKDVALYWAGGGGTETPPGMNLRIALDATNRHGLGTMRQARVLAYAGAALADAAVAAWDSKFTYWADRPVTTIRRLWDPNWTPLIATPPFPGYISGHATFSSAAATVLSHFFPDEAVSFRSMATEAAMSRYYAGIHVRYDNEAGLDVGARIGDLAAERAMNDGASDMM